MLKLLKSEAPASVKVELLTASKILPLLKKTNTFIVSKICLCKQFTGKFLGVTSTNGSLKNVIFSKSILIIVQ